MIARAALVLLAATCAGLAWVAAAGPEVELSPEFAASIGWRQDWTDERALDEAVREAATPADLAARVSEAVARGDAVDATLWVAVADGAAMRLPEAARRDAAALAAEQESVWAQIESFAGGYVTGEAEDLPGFFGALASDLTVVGDLRDLGREGGAMIAGREYSEFILGLSVVGVAATTATVATGGGGAAVRFGVSLAKFAKRTGALTAGFAARLLRLTDEAVDLPAFKALLRRLDLNDVDGSLEAIRAYARGVRQAEIFRVLGRLDEIRANAGAAETLRLMKRIERVEDVDDLADLSKAAGKRTRGIVELTGKASLRALKYGAKLAALILDFLWALLSWIAALVAPLLWRAARFAAGGETRAERARLSGR